MVFRQVEQFELLPLPIQPYEEVVWKHAKVQPNAHVEYDGRFYSVPWGYIGQSAWIQATPTSVFVHIDEVRQATHRRQGKGQWSTVEAHLPKHRKDLRYRSRSYWEERADRIGPETGALIREVFASDDVLSLLRSAQAIVQYLEKHPVRRAENGSLLWQLPIRRHQAHSGEGLGYGAPAPSDCHVPRTSADPTVCSEYSRNLAGSAGGKS